MSMILRINISYKGDATAKSWTKEQRDQMREAVMALRNHEEPTTNTYKDSTTGEDKSYIWYNLSGEYLVTEEEAAWLKNHGIDYDIKDFKNNYKPEKQASGSQYHYHLPNIGLLLINEVTWLEDACTQELQQKLDEGFRIVAVCPPNGQRRPDYILGRTKND